MQLQVLHFHSYSWSVQYILVATENQHQQNIFPLWIVPWLLACQEQSPVLRQESPPRMIWLSCNSAMQSQLCVSTGCCQVLSETSVTMAWQVVSRLACWGHTVQLLNHHKPGSSWGSGDEKCILLACHRFPHPHALACSMDWNDPPNVKPSKMITDNEISTRSKS